jgi:hypothetical protein
MKLQRVANVGDDVGELFQLSIDTLQLCEQAFVFRLGLFAAMNICGCTIPGHDPSLGIAHGHGAGEQLAILPVMPMVTHFDLIVRSVFKRLGPLFYVLFLSLTFLMQGVALCKWLNRGSCV